MGRAWWFRGLGFMGLGLRVIIRVALSVIIRVAIGLLHASRASGPNINPQKLTHSRN